MIAVLIFFSLGILTLNLGLPVIGGMFVGAAITILWKELL